MLRILFYLLLTTLMISCKGQDSNGYIKSSKLLMKYLSMKDLPKIVSLIRTSAIKKSKEENFVRDKNYIVQYIDSIPNLDKLKYNISVNNNDAINNTLVSIPLRENLYEKTELIVFFSSDKNNGDNKIENYQFSKNLKSYNFKNHPSVRFKQ